MMKIRLTGEVAELEQAIEKIKAIFDVIDVSKLYKNRNSLEYRIYITVKEKC